MEMESHLPLSPTRAQHHLMAGDPGIPSVLLPLQSGGTLPLLPPLGTQPSLFQYDGGNSGSEDEGEEDEDEEDGGSNKKKRKATGGGAVKGKKVVEENNLRRKIEIGFIEKKEKRHITFSKRKAGIMKKAYELATLTGTQVLLLVVSESGIVYTFTTSKFKSIVGADSTGAPSPGQRLIQACLATPDENSGESPHGDQPLSSSAATRVFRATNNHRGEPSLRARPSSLTPIIPNRPLDPIPLLPRLTSNNRSPTVPLQEVKNELHTSPHQAQQSQQLDHSPTRQYYPADVQQQQQQQHLQQQQIHHQQQQQQQQHQQQQHHLQQPQHQQLHQVDNRGMNPQDYDSRAPIDYDRQYGTQDYGYPQHDLHQEHHQLHDQHQHPLLSPSLERYPSIPTEQQQHHSHQYTPRGSPAMNSGMYPTLPLQQQQQQQGTPQYQGHLNQPDEYTTGMH